MGSHPREIPFFRGSRGAGAGLGDMAVASRKQSGWFDDTTAGKGLARGAVAKCSQVF